MANATPIPAQDPIAIAGGMIGQRWVEYFTAQDLAVSNAPARVGLAALTAQGATIPATDLTSGAQSAGLFRVSEYQRVTTVAGTSSSLTFTLTYTDHGQAMSFTGAAMTGNTTTTAQSNVFVFYSDGGSPITYTLTYASNAAGVMRFEAYIALEKLA